MMGGIPALLNDSQGLGHIGQQEGPTEAVKVVRPIEYGHAPLRLHHSSFRIKLQLT